MRLVDLNPTFIGSGGEGVSNADGSPAVVRSGVGLVLDCPCGKGGEDHQLYVPFANPLDGGAPLDKRSGWQRTGETFDTWHGFITNGEVRSV